jgi:hypothetical protein
MNEFKKKGVNMLSVEKFNDLEIGVAEVKEHIDKNKRKHVEIKILDYDLGKFLEATNYTIPKGFEWVKKILYLVPIRKLRFDEKRHSIMVKFKQPVEFCLLDHKELGTFRLYPINARYAVNKMGDLYDIINDEFIKYTYNKSYLLYPYYVKNVPEKMVHRVLGLTWLENDDYVKKFVIDHIDENKLNFNLENLRWVDMYTNNSRSSYAYDKPVDNRWIVKSVKTGRIFYFPSYRELAEFFGVNYGNIETKKPPFIIQVKDDIFIVEDSLNFTNWSLLEKAYEYGYRWKIINLKNNKSLMFKNVEDIYNYFGTTEYRVKGGYKGDAHEALKTFLAKKGYIIKKISDKKIYNQNTTDKYWIEAMDLDTGEIIREPSTSKMAEKLLGNKKNKSTIIIRLNGNKREGLPLEVNGKRYLIRRDDMPWPKVRETKKPKQKEAIVYFKDNVYKFSSLREAAKQLGLGRTSVRNSKIGEDDKYVYVKIPERYNVVLPEHCLV